MSIIGIVRNGQIELPQGVSLAEGARVQIEVAKPVIDPATAKTELGRKLLELAGTCDGLPEEGTQIPLKIPETAPTPLEANDNSRRELPRDMVPWETDEPIDGYALNRELLKFSGIIKDTPADYAVNHDHYLYGAPKTE